MSQETKPQRIQNQKKQTHRSTRETKSYIYVNKKKRQRNPTNLLSPKAHACRYQPPQLHRSVRVYPERLSSSYSLRLPSQSDESETVEKAKSVAEGGEDSTTIDFQPIKEKLYLFLGFFFTQNFSKWISKNDVFD